MSISNKYDRFFVLLKQEASGYNINDKKVTGNCVMEIKEGKGKLTTYIQGLKPIDGGRIYRLYLIAPNNSKVLGIPASKIHPDPKGKIEVKWEFDPINIEKSGFSYEKFEIFAVFVCSANGDLDEIISPLVGYKDNEIIWKHNFEDFSKVTKSVVNEDDIREIEPVHTEENLDKEDSKIIDIKTKLEIPDNPAEVKTENRLTDKFKKDVKSCVTEEQHSDFMSLLLDLEKALPDELFASTIGLWSSLLDLLPETKYGELFEIAIDIYKSSNENDLGMLITNIMKMLLTTVEPEFLSKLFAHMDKIEPYLESPITKAISKVAIRLTNKEEVKNDDVSENIKEEVQEQREYANADDFFSVFDSNARKIDEIENRFKDTIQSVNERFGEIESQSLVSPDEMEMLQSGLNPPNETELLHRGLEEIRYSEQNELDLIFDFNQEMAPFEADNDFKWIRISIDDVAILPISIWKFMNHPFVVSCYKRFEHFILGRYPEGNAYKYVFGIPDLFKEEYDSKKPLGEFDKFRHCEGVSNQQSGPNPGPEPGYWVINL